MNKATAPKKARNHYDEDFKRRVLDNWRTSGRSAREIGAEFGVPAFTLYDWRSKAALQAPRGGPEERDGLATEVTRLREELARVTEQRDILKKSLGILCEPPRKSMPTSKH
jgi:transposase